MIGQTYSRRVAAPWVYSGVETPGKYFGDRQSVGDEASESI